MGKIRIKSFDEDEQKKQEERKKAKKETKKLTKAPGLKGGEKVAVVGPSIEEVETKKTSEEEKPLSDKKTKKKEKFVKKKAYSKRYTQNVSQIKKDTLYSLDKAIDLLKKLKKTKFDETVELHVNTKEKGLSGQIALPYGTGKKLRIVEADDSIIANIEKGNIDFDVLVATPQMMPKLAKVARILGPRGLMPNPKTGTITTNPLETIEKLSKGQVNYKTELDAPIIHLSVGKLSFDEKKLNENVKMALVTIGEAKIVNATLKSTMSPGIKLKVA